MNNERNMHIVLNQQSVVLALQENRREDLRKTVIKRKIQLMKQTVAGIDYCKLNKYHGLDLYSKLQESFIIFKDCANSRLASKNDIFVFECEHGTSDVYSKSFMRNIGEIKKTLLVLRMVAEKKTSREIMRSCTREFLNKIRNLYNTAAPSKIASPEQQVNEVFQFHVLDFYIKNIVETEV